MASVNDKRGIWHSIKGVLRVVSIRHCIEAALLALLGLLITRMLVGIARFSQNIVFIPFIYSCVAIAGMLSVPMVRNQYDPNRDTTRIARVVCYTTTTSCAIAIGGCIVLSAWYGITIEQELPAIMLPAVFCSAWVMIPIILNKVGRDAWTCTVLIPSTYSGGLLFGMLMNAYEVPLYACFVVAGFFFLILGREIVKDCIQQRSRDGETITSRNRGRFKGSSPSRPRSTNTFPTSTGSRSRATSSSLASILGVSKALRLSGYLFIVAIPCLLVPIFTGIWNYAFYAYLIVPACVVLALVACRLNGNVLNINQLDRQHKNARVAAALVVIGLIFQFIF
ncbi:MAG: hypothetical protein GYA24_22690 [Candidatus Lokiarchaeota archaeon]|nr:hypothetical protein [Candidatus Lokiarchaeota archaeon]